MKLGSDAIGTVLGLLTIPMALLTFGSVASGVALAVGRNWSPVLYGLAAVAAGLVLAPLLERLVIAIDDAAAIALAGGRPRLARVVALGSGVLPVAVIFAAEITVLRSVVGSTPVPTLLDWLWGYGAATAPWTLFAERVSRFRRTLVGVRAYFGHVAVWLFSLSVLWLDAGPVLVVALLMASAFVPVTAGFLLALSDREAIANVRV